MTLFWIKSPTRGLFETTSDDRRSGFNLCALAPVILAAVIFSVSPYSDFDARATPRKSPPQTTPSSWTKTEIRQLRRAPKKWRLALSQADPDNTFGKDILRFYRQRKYGFAWQGSNNNNQLKITLEQRLGRADLDGLSAINYPISGFNNSTNPWISDISATRSALRFIADIATGQRRPEFVNPEYDLPNKPIDLASALSKIRQSKNFNQAISQLEPIHPNYAWLKSILVELNTGKREDRFLQPVREQPFGSSADNPSVRLSAAIAANLDRWRWLERDLGTRYIWINIPAYSVSLIDNGSRVFTSKTIVGKPTARTPLISSKISNIVLNPYWNMPASYVKAKILPLLKGENGEQYLADKKISVLRRRGKPVDPTSIEWAKVNNPWRYRFRQSPGRENALGRVKISFPNSNAIFLHDTNEPELFGETNRARSLGCVRLQRPIAFADAIASMDSRLTSQMPGTLLGAKEHWLKYSANLKVYLTYFTVLPGNDGTLRIIPDIYGYDQRMAKAAANTGISQETAFSN